MEYMPLSDAVISVRRSANMFEIIPPEDEKTIIQTKKVIWFDDGTDDKVPLPT